VVQVRAQRVGDGLPVLLATQQRLPRVQVLRLVKVAAGHVRIVLEAGDREEVVAIGRLPDVDEAGETLPVIPEVASGDLDAPRRAVLWVASDAQRPLSPD